MSIMTGTLQIERMHNAKPVAKGDLMKSILRILLAVTVASGAAVAKDLPNAPSADMAAMTPAVIVSTVRAPQPVVEKPVVDKKFIALAIVSGGSIFADSYTTMFATQNWLAGKTNVCNVELQSAYLYGTHPTNGRVYAVASAKTAGSLIAAYYLRKHHSKFWSLPLIGTAATSLQGVTQNMRACN
jgi:hypothetical protein